NADLRLTDKGIAWGCIGGRRATAFTAYKTAVTHARERALAEGGYPDELARQGIAVRSDGRRRSVFELLGNQAIGPRLLVSAFPWLATIPCRALGQVQTEARYDGYLPRQQSDIRAFLREENVPLNGVQFNLIGGLSGELTAKLTALRPGSLGAAAR